jgi:hypothetical protein
VFPFLREHHSAASAGVASGIVLAVIAIKVAARIDMRIGAGTSSENANDAFEFSMTASVFGYWQDAHS